MNNDIEIRNIQNELSATTRIIFPLCFVEMLKERSWNNIMVYYTVLLPSDRLTIELYLAHWALWYICSINKSSGAKSYTNSDKLVYIPSQKFTNFLWNNLLRQCTQVIPHKIDLLALLDEFNSCSQQLPIRSV